MTRKRLPYYLLTMWCAVMAAGFAEEEKIPLTVPCPQAAAEAAAGERDTASAAWWGFDPEDATDTLQQAIDSGVSRLLVPYMGALAVSRAAGL